MSYRGYVELRCDSAACCRIVTADTRSAAAGDAAHLGWAVWRRRSFCPEHTPRVFVVGERVRWRDDGRNAGLAGIVEQTNHLGECRVAPDGGKPFMWSWATVEELEPASSGGADRGPKEVRDGEERSTAREARMSIDGLASAREADRG